MALSDMRKAAAARRWCLAAALLMASAAGCAQGTTGRHPGSAPAPPTPGQSSFASQMDHAMQVMGRDMDRAPMNGNVDHDFASMMVPHHQGAVDMAKAELLYGKDPVLRRLAQEIIVTQEAEITVMRLQLKKMRAAPAAPVSAP